ncbi:MAG: isoprenyl transferase [Ezakiella sp.]|nr:isoprenyl transferase [Ezakiella sp.]MDD7471969.1 isoprenyl transferase [Bacillota bacterium]MDY3923933.1 isoprenyl transferase [Ezakiella sp.]
MFLESVGVFQLIFFTLKSEMVFLGDFMHVAIIMDGNGRWAKKRGLARTVGHKKGMEVVIKTIEWANERDIDTLTLYAFSAENWKRPRPEVEFLMNLLVIYVDRELMNLHKKNAKINVLGSMKELPKIVQEKLNWAINLTKDNTGLVVNFAINYSSRLEIEHALKDFAHDARENEDIDTSYDSFKNYLYTKKQEDPDLIIRTSGEKRLSNFLLLQSAYSELMFIDTLWPDLNEQILDKCLEDFKSRDRRFGGIKDE